ncbi:unnamed protein product [Nippostrongylus brasiliensis]|uniref:Secreted protein n=1 Tax=Nippostrongylus brasiliensis TaxID=27835 RepID=A0A0N4XWA7_NIPBR|nr:unnamed protein product [Nippostrongylus brasiliensis]
MQANTSFLSSLTSEASRDDSDILLVIVMCVLFCFAVRHANDFYAGETKISVKIITKVTLVEEGLWSGRFRHKIENRMLSNIEADFNNMYQNLKDKESVLVTKTENVETISY